MFDFKSHLSDLSYYAVKILIILPKSRKTSKCFPFST